MTLNKEEIEISILFLRKEKEKLKNMFIEIGKSKDHLEGGYYDIVMNIKTAEIKKIKKFDSDPDNEIPWMSITQFYKAGRSFDDNWIKTYMKKPLKNFNKVVKMFNLCPEWKGK